jgi:hypothetical protein
MDATLLTKKGISDRPVWSEQFRESAVACQSDAVAKDGKVKGGAAPRQVALRDRPEKMLASSIAR